jgi:hypothetical protein
LKNLPEIIKKFLKPAWERGQSISRKHPLTEARWRLLNESLATGTWKRYGVAITAWKAFMKTERKDWNDLDKKRYADLFAGVTWRET